MLLSLLLLAAASNAPPDEDFNEVAREAAPTEDNRPRLPWFVEIDKDPNAVPSISTEYARAQATEDNVLMDNIDARYDARRAYSDCVMAAMDKRVKTQPVLMVASLHAMEDCFGPGLQFRYLAFITLPDEQEREAVIWEAEYTIRRAAVERWQ